MFFSTVRWGLGFMKKVDYRNPVNYYDYLKSPQWQRRAFEAKRRARFRCQICNAPGHLRRLETHHRTYARLGREDPEDLLVACNICHQIISENVELWGDGIRE